jgi:O-antigen ligase
VDTHPHNDYLKVAIELGLLGVLAYGAWLLSLMRHAWRAHRCAQNTDIGWRALGLLAVVIAGAAVSVVSNYLGNTAVQWYLWTLVALVPREGQWPTDADG